MLMRHYPWITFFKGVEYLAIADRHSGMLSVHATAHRGVTENTETALSEVRNTTVYLY